MKKASSEYKKVNGIKSLLATSAHSVLIFVILLASGSWAWFSTTVKDSGNQIQTGAYGLHVDVISGNDTIASEDYRGTTGTGSHVIEVENGNVYKIVLSVPEDETLRTEYGGYCIVSAGDDLHYTVPIGGVEDGVITLDEVENEISFQMWFPGTGTSRIEFLPYWGTYPLTLPKEWGEEMIPGEDDILEDSKKYVVSDGDIIVSPGDSMPTENPESVED